MDWTGFVVLSKHAAFVEGELRWKSHVPLSYPRTRALSGLTIATKRDCQEQTAFYRLLRDHFEVFALVHEERLEAGACPHEKSGQARQPYRM